MKFVLDEDDIISAVLLYLASKEVTITGYSKINVKATVKEGDVKLTVELKK